MSSLNPISAIEVLANYLGSTAKVWEVLAILGFYSILYLLGLRSYRIDSERRQGKLAANPNHEPLTTKLYAAYCAYRNHFEEFRIDRGRSKPFEKEVKLAVFGDIHSNIEALRAVIEDAREQGCTHFACTGDVVGYHANPNECIEMLRELDCPVVRGEHDFTAGRRSDAWGYRHDRLAHESLVWTREKLTRSNRRWLSKLPYVWHVFGVTLVHTSLARPEYFRELRNDDHVWRSFCAQDRQVCFRGHTHIQTVHQKQDGKLDLVTDSEFTLCSKSDYLIDVGSVGKPPTADQGATYLIHDQEQETIMMRSVPYNLKETLRKAREAGLVGPEETPVPSRVVNIAQAS